MELREGMYIRSKDKRGNQFVRIIVELPNVPVYGSIVVDKDIHNVKWVSKKNVLKASNSIIDLIKVGYYVNGKKVDRISFIEDTYYIKTKVSNTNNYDYLPEHLIETILTKEQFENMAYKIEKSNK